MDKKTASYRDELTRYFARFRGRNTDPLQTRKIVLRACIAIDNREPVTIQDVRLLYVVAQLGAIALGHGPYAISPEKPHRRSLKIEEAKKTQASLAQLLTLAQYGRPPTEDAMEVVLEAARQGLVAVGLARNRMGRPKKPFPVIDQVRMKLAIHYREVARKQYSLAKALDEVARARTLKEKLRQFTGQTLTEKLELTYEDESEIARWRRQLEVEYHKMGPITADERHAYRNRQACILRAERLTRRRQAQSFVTEA